MGAAVGWWMVMNGGHEAVGVAVIYCVLRRNRAHMRTRAKLCFNSSIIKNLKSWNNFITSVFTTRTLLTRLWHGLVHHPHVNVWVVVVAGETTDHGSG